MGTIKEHVTMQRAQVALLDTVLVSDTVYGPAIDTADYENGLYFAFYLSAWTAGVSTLVIQHSDDDTTGFEDVEQKHLVYGRNDGLLPILSAAVAESDYLAREGVVGTKRYVRVGVAGDGSISGVDAVVLAILDSEFCPTASDATYA